MAKKKIDNMTASEREKRIKDLKIELLKQVQKRKSIKKEIARLLTMEKQENVKKESKATGKTQTKLVEDKK